MGTEIKKVNFSEADKASFKSRVDEQLRALDVVLRRKAFGVGQRRLGAELELCLVDQQGRPYAISEKLIREADSPVITPEMGAFDIELSTLPVTLEGTPFSALRENMQSTVRRIRALAERHGGRVVPISILPTLRNEDFGVQSITNLPRYRALARGLRAGRRCPFEIAIDGEDSLRVQSYDAVAMEAANNAFQVHVTTRPDEFKNLYNAAVLLSAPALAAAGNSPTFLGKRLWHETRVALFKQAGDDRPRSVDADTAMPPRVNFGNGWVHEGAHELFLESAALHPVLLPECGPEERSLDLAMAGKVPKLRELRLHHGTVWTWNRPVYDPEQGGNLRIELRPLPAGPSYDDMLANAAFLVGAMLALRDRMPQLVATLPFPLAKQNFYAAAKHGLEATLFWPLEPKVPPVPIRARELLCSLIPLAREGLLAGNVEPAEVEVFLGVFEARVRSGQTGAVWQKMMLSRLYSRGHRGYDALTRLLELYFAGFESQRPVHAWPLQEEARQYV